MKFTKSKISAKTLEKIANAWYSGNDNGVGIGKYRFKIAYNWDRKSWGVFRARRDELAWRFNDEGESPWEYVQDLDREQFQSICDQEVLEGWI